METKNEPLQERPINKATAWKFVRISLYANFSLIALVVQDDLTKLGTVFVAFFIINFIMFLLQRVEATP